MSFFKYTSKHEAKVDSHIRRLESLTPVINTVIFDGEAVQQLFNPITHTLCQVYEYYVLAASSRNHKVADHYYEDSDELFYVITGELKFNDGTVLKTGDHRLIKAGTEHGCTLSKEGKVIIIARPPVPEYEIPTD